MLRGLSYPTAREKTKHVPRPLSCSSVHVPKRSALLLPDALSGGLPYFGAASIATQVSLLRERSLVVCVRCKTVLSDIERALGITPGGSTGKAAPPWTCLRGKCFATCSSPMGGS